MKEKSSILREITNSSQKLAQKPTIGNIQIFLNTLSNLISLPKVTFSKNFKIENQNILSLNPKIEFLNLKQELLSLPINTDKFLNDSNLSIESQIKSLNEVLKQVKQLFFTRENQIDEMASLISSQHEAILEISKNPKNSNILIQSKKNFHRSQEIQKEIDHFLK